MIWALSQGALGADYKSGGTVKGSNSLALLTDGFHIEDIVLLNSEKNDPLLLESSLIFSKNFQKHCIYHLL